MVQRRLQPRPPWLSVQQPDLDTINVNGTLNSDSLNGSGNLTVGTGISGSNFVIATDPSDAPGVEIGLRADMRFQPVAPRDPSDPTKFYTAAGVAGGTINDNTSTTADDLWARWNYVISINADTDNTVAKHSDRCSTALCSRTSPPVSHWPM